MLNPPQRANTTAIRYKNEIAFAISTWIALSAPSAEPWSAESTREDPTLIAAQLLKYFSYCNIINNKITKSL